MARYLVDDTGTVIRELNDDEFLQVKSPRKVIKKRDGVEINIYFAKTQVEHFCTCCAKYSIFPCLAKYIDYFNNTLTFDNGRPLKSTNITKICPLTVRTIRNQIKAMRDDEILAKVEIEGRKYLCINPWIIHRGKYTSRIVYDLFKDSKWSDDNGKSTEIYT